MSDETLGELSRRLDRAERDCNQRAATHVDSQLYAAERNHMNIQLVDLRSDLSMEVARLQSQVDSLKGRMTWAWRAALTGIAFPVIAGLVVAAVLALRGAA